MKALTYLELISENFKDVHINMDLNEQKRFFAKKLECSKNELLAEKVWKFYSQPFKPKLIEQLFEGWGINRLGQYANNECKIDIHKNHIEYNNGYKLFYFVIPSTLNDFISDAKRVGIELTFKEQK